MNVKVAAGIRKILARTSRAPEKFRMSRLAGMAFNQALPEETRDSAREVTIFAAPLIAKGLIDPISVAHQAHQMLEEIDQIRIDLAAAEQTAQSLRKQLAERPTADKLTEQEETIQKLTSQVKTLGADLDKALKQKEEARSSISELLKTAEEEAQSLSEDPAQRALEQDERIEKLRKDLKEKENALERAARQMATKNESAQRLKRTIESLNTDLKEANGKLKQVEKEKRKLEMTLTEREKILKAQVNATDNLNTSLQQARVEKEDTLKINRKLESQIKTLRDRGDQAKEEELQRAKTEADKLRKTIQKKLLPKGLAFLADLEKRNPHALYLIRHLADTLAKIALSEVQQIRILDIILDYVEPILDSEQVTSQRIREQLGLLGGQRLTHDLIRHLHENYLEEIRQHRNDKDKEVAEGANMVWNHWLRSILEYFSQHPRDTQTYEEFLPYLAEHALVDLETIISLPHQDARIRETSRRIKQDAEALSQPKADAKSSNGLLGFLRKRGRK